MRDPRPHSTTFPEHGHGHPNISRARTISMVTLSCWQFSHLTWELNPPLDTVSLAVMALDKKSPLVLLRFSGRTLGSPYPHRHGSIARARRPTSRTPPLSPCPSPLSQKGLSLDSSHRQYTSPSASLPHPPTYPRAGAYRASFQSPRQYGRQWLGGGCFLRFALESVAYEVALTMTPKTPGRHHSSFR